MIDLNELSQLVAFADLGTLSRVAEEFHISTPSITRSMQHLEEASGVPLFLRGKNKIELNETGKMAVAAAERSYGRQRPPSVRCRNLTHGSTRLSSSPVRLRLCGNCKRT